MNRQKLLEMLKENAPALYNEIVFKETQESSHKTDIKTEIKNPESEHKSESDSLKAGQENNLPWE